MLNKQPNSVVTLALLLALIGTPKPATASLLAQAQPETSSFPVPDSIPKGTVINIAGSNSTTGMSQNLQEGFKQKFPGAEINIEAQNAAAALESLSSGKADLAAIGRNLTDEEKQQGFTAIPFSREKIAIVISQDNSFDGNLTIDQFAQIFRGEITDWSELGGSPGAIEFVDLPDSNDTRQAFPNYPVFSGGEFATGSNAVKLEQDSVDAIAEKIGSNGVSFAVANDIASREDLKAVTMHQTQPDDPRYPFSQPFVFVYKGTPSPVAQAFLGFVTTDAGQQIIQARNGSVPILTTSAAAGSAAVTDLAQKSGTNINAKPSPEGSDSQPGGETATTAEGSSAAPGGETAATADGSDSDATIAPDASSGDNAVASKKGSSKWYLWLLTLPILALGLFALGRRSSKSDQEPAVDNVPGYDPTVTSKTASPSSSDDGSLSVDDRINNDFGQVASSTASSSASKVDGTTLAAGAALAGGAAAASSRFEGTVEQTEEEAELEATNLAQETVTLEKQPDDSENLDVTESPTENTSIPTSEFTETEQATKLQTNDLAEDISDTTSDLRDETANYGGTVMAGGAALAGGAAASNFLGRTDEEQADAEPTEQIETTSVDYETDISTEQSTRLQTNDNNVESEVVDQFADDFILEEETDDFIADYSESSSSEQVTEIDEGVEVAGSDTFSEPTVEFTANEADDDYYVSSEQVTEIDESTEIADSDTFSEPTVELTNRDNNISDDYTDNVAQEVSDNFSEDTDTGDAANIMDSATTIGGVAAAGGMAAAASNFFDGNQEQTEAVISEDLDTRTSEFDDVNKIVTEENESISAKDIPNAEIFTEQTTRLQVSDKLDDATTESLDLEFTGDTSVDLDSELNTTEVNFDSASVNDVADAEIVTEQATKLQTTDTINQTFSTGDVDAIGEIAEVDSNFFETTEDETISFEDVDISLDEISLDESDRDVDINNISLDEISFDESDRDVDINNISLDEITFDESESNEDSISNLLDDSRGENLDISLDEINFDESESNEDSISNLLDDVQDSSTESSENTPDEIDNISEWLDSLETSSTNSDNISEWLDNLGTNTTSNMSDNPETDRDSIDENNSSISNLVEDVPQREVDSKSRIEDISFQFLEDLLERDSESNQDKK